MIVLFLLAYAGFFNKIAKINPVVLKIFVYVLGLLFYLVPMFLLKVVDGIMFSEVSLIVYVVLGLFAFLSKSGVSYFVAIQWVIFLPLSFFIGGFYSCSQYDCGLEFMYVLMPLLYIPVAALVWYVLDRMVKNRSDLGKKK